MLLVGYFIRLTFFFLLLQGLSVSLLAFGLSAKFIQWLKWFSVLLRECWPFLASKHK